VRITLRCPDGHEIDGTVEMVRGIALIQDTADFRPDGTVKIEYAGETKMDWDSQTSVMEGRERIFSCTDGHEWRESQLVKAPLKRKRKKKE
jgi:hypothetical protein